MPCYLFTWHAYGAWMPDRDKGYVRRQEGLLPPDKEMAATYRDAQTEATATFDHAAQQVVVEALSEATAKLAIRLHGVATDPTHIHCLVSWREDTSWERIRRSLRSALTRKLNAQIGKRKWLTKTGSRRRIKNQKHFDYLMTTYLPQHRGICWIETDGR